MHAILGDPRRLRVAGAHALMPLAAAAATVLLLAGPSSSGTSSAALACRGIRRGLCPVRIEGGEDPHVALATASTAAPHGAEPQLLPGKQRHRCREVHEM